MTDPNNEPRILAALAPIRVPPEREAVLAAGLATTKSIAETLGSWDFGVSEPAAQFRAPPPA
jgi:hypothetical protein